MENDSLFLNDSNTTSNLMGEFPFWRLTLGITLFIYILVLGGIILILYLSILVALLKSKNERHNPLKIVHISLLMTPILESILQILFYAVYLPSIYRHCVCSRLVGVLFLSINVVLSVYQAIAFTGLGVLQFLVVLGKERFVNLKSACGVIALSAGISLIPVIEVVRLLHDSSEQFVCYDILCPSSRSQSGDSVYINVLVSTALGYLLPSLIVVIIVSTWSFVVFKKYYIGEDDQLSRRMLSLPIVMPVVILASTVIELISRILLGQGSALSLGDYFPYWILFIQSQLLIFITFITRVAYPLMLIYTQPHLRQVFKKLPRQFKGANSVAPSVAPPNPPPNRPPNPPPYSSSSNQ